jgi:hypothetical protein
LPEVEGERESKMVEMSREMEVLQVEEAMEIRAMS